MTRAQTLAATVRQSHTLLARYLVGFDDGNCLTQFPNLPNHVSWTLGHLALTMYRVASKIDAVDAPQSVFMDGPVGDALRFGTESIAFGSRPKPDPTLYPAYERCRGIFDDATDRLEHAFESANDSILDKEVGWGRSMVPVWTLAARICFHNGTHCGQVVDLRRALGMDSALG